MALPGKQQGRRLPKGMASSSTSSAPRGRGRALGRGEHFASYAGTNPGRGRNIGGTTTPTGRAYTGRTARLRNPRVQAQLRSRAKGMRAKLKKI